MRATVGTNPALQPRPGGTLRLGMVGDLSVLDGHSTAAAAIDTIWGV